MSNIDYCFRIYGDNILECELLVDWLNDKNSGFLFVSEDGPIDRPILIYQDSLTNKTFGFHMTPFYGGTQRAAWPNSPLAGTFNEKPDVLVVKINPDYTESKPILVIEFDDALQAGNQSWQRSRRAVDAANAKIPYFYVLPLIGWEKASDGLSLKNPRFQNAMVTTGQLSLSFKEKTISLQIYKNSSWSDFAKKKGYRLPDNYETFNGITHAVILVSYLIRSSVMNKIKAPKEELEQAILEMLNVARLYSNFSSTYLPIHSNHPALDSRNAVRVASQLSSMIFNNRDIANHLNLNTITSTDFYQNGSLFFKDVKAKTTTINFQSSLLRKINWKQNDMDVERKTWLNRWGIVIDDSFSLEENARRNKTFIPISYKDKKSEAAVIRNRKVMRSLIETTYPDLDDSILNWIYFENTSDEPIFFIPLYGYKPTGDSRPDRGLIPYLYSNFPKLLTKRNTLVIMYSKYVPDSWVGELKNTSNQLWVAIRNYCGLVIVDRTGSGQLL